MNYKNLLHTAFLTGLLLITLTAFSGSALGAPIVEAETSSTEQTQWGWYYNQTAATINEFGKQNNFRPIALVANGEIESEPHYHVLYVKNAGEYQVAEWTVVARTLENVEKFSTPAYRSTGWRITNIAVHEIKEKINGKDVVSKRAGTIAVKDPALYADYDVRSFITKKDLLELGNKNFRVVDLDTFEVNGTTAYSAVFVPNTGGNYKLWGWLFGLTRNEILAKAKNINNKAFRLTDIERRADGKYDALLVESKGEVGKWYVNQTDATLKNDVLRRHGSYNGGNSLYGGARFMDLVAYKDGGTTKYEVLTMENGVGKYPVNRDNVKGFEAIDQAFLKTMSRHGIPGANFALSKNGKVVYRAAYGYADLASATPATQNNRGRIASISKTITAAAIMKLVEEKKLDLGDQVFGDKGILSSLKPFDYEGYQGNSVPTLEKITVRHLLTHTAGWDRGTSGDPTVDVDTDQFTCNGKSECEPTMTLLPQILAHAKKQKTVAKDAKRLSSIDDIIRYMMKPDDKDFLPTFAPGTKFAYSNFGYTVLQKIIEVKSGKSYENYIKDLAAQMGVQFTAGRSEPANRLLNEWTYHDDPGSNGTTGVYWNTDKLNDPVPFSYSVDMNMLLGHGGWVTTPTDLVKFASKMDGTAGNPWLPYDLFKSMMERPAYIPKDKYTFYGLNWAVDQLKNDTDDKFRFEHGGALTGAGGLILRGWYDRKISMAYLFNFRADEATKEMKKGIDALITSKDEDGTLAALAK